MIVEGLIQIASVIHPLNIIKIGKPGRGLRLLGEICFLGSVYG